METVQWSRLGVAALAVLLLTGGCATRKYVRAGDAATRDDLGWSMAELEGAVESLQESVDGRFERQDGQIAEVSRTAREALERAVAAGKLAQGKLLWETVLTDDRVRFGFDRADLSDEARTALNDFADRVKRENANVYVEIQGHTDATGSEEYNLRLGERRAESVRRFLNSEHGIPLHRLSVISYGEGAPLGPNGSREQRALNRRVSLVVLM